MAIHLRGSNSLRNNVFLVASTAMLSSFWTPCCRESGSSSLRCSSLHQAAYCIPWHPWHPVHSWCRSSRQRQAGAKRLSTRWRTPRRSGPWTRVTCRSSSRAWTAAGSQRWALPRGKGDAAECSINATTHSMATKPSTWLPHVHDQELCWYINALSVASCVVSGPCLMAGGGDGGAGAGCKGCGQAGQRK